MRSAEARLENELRSALGVAMKVSIAREPELGDRMRGQRALERVIGGLGETDDPRKIRFPNARLSLTHARGISVAVGTHASARGVGVDLEVGDGPRPGTERFFLGESERRAIGRLEPRSRLRLWTVKEALYKADLGNASAWFTDYLVDDPRSDRGSAHVTRAGASLAMHYASFELMGGYLTVAVCR